MTEPRPEPAAVDSDGLPVVDPNFKANQKEIGIAFFSGESVVEPKMHAADPGWFRDLSAKIPGLLVESAGGVCPFQSEGTLQGMPYYFRYRSGYVSLTTMEPLSDDVDEVDTLCPLYVAGTEFGEPLDGYLNRQQFVDLMLALVPQLEPAAFLWEFEGVEVKVEDLANPAPEDWEAALVRQKRPRRRERPSARPAPRAERNPPEFRFTATDTPHVYRARGVTPAEAYENLFTISGYLLSHGWSEEAQRTNNATKAIDPTPLNHDYRAFPYPRPTFEVRP